MLSKLWPFRKLSGTAARCKRWSKVQFAINTNNGILMNYISEVEGRLDEAVLTLTYGHERTHRHRLELFLLLAGQIIASPSGTDAVKYAEKLWKKCHYGPFDHLRKLMRMTKGGDQSGGKAIAELLDKCIGQYVVLMGCLGGGRLSSLLDSLGLAAVEETEGLASTDLCSILAVHLGDLFRYLSSCNSTLQLLRKAGTCYAAACLWDPENGLPWNQLAVLALQTLDARDERRIADPLEPIYYYVRAADCQRPFPAAMANLRAYLASSQSVSRQATHDPLLARLIDVHVNRRHLMAVDPDVASSANEADERRLFISDFLNRTPA